MIGGTTTFANVIALNSGAGVRVDGAGTGGTDVHRNRIFRNGGLGINLRPPGEGVEVVTANDAGDADTGPNGLQNRPAITSALGTAITGTLNSTPNTTFRIDVHRNPATVTVAAAEAETFVATKTVTTDGAGNASWSVTSGSFPGQRFTATATNVVTGETSEISAAVTAA